MNRSGRLSVLTLLAMLPILSASTDPAQISEHTGIELHGAAAANADCTIFQDWLDLDSWYQFWRSGHDPFHRGWEGANDAPGDWEFQMNVSASGEQHSEVRPNLTHQSAEHTRCDYQTT